jgi:hypothetical protein
LSFTIDCLGCCLGCCPCCGPCLKACLSCCPDPGRLYQSEGRASVPKAEGPVVQTMERKFFEL